MSSKLEPHVCPVCVEIPGEYFGRLARVGTPEACPNHTTVSTDENGDRIEKTEVVYLVPVKGTPARRNRFGLTGEDPR